MFLIFVRAIGVHGRDGFFGRSTRYYLFVFVLAAFLVDYHFASRLICVLFSYFHLFFVFVFGTFCVSYLLGRFLWGVYSIRLFYRHLGVLSRYHGEIRFYYASSRSYSRAQYRWYLVGAGSAFYHELLGPIGYYGASSSL